MKLVLPIYIGIFLLAGCGTTKVTDEQYLHSLSVTWDGEPLEIEKAPSATRIPDGNIADFDIQLETILAEIKDKKPARIVVFIHGGLNTLEGALERTQDAARAIKAWNCEHPGDTVYPIFINWHSRFLTWYDHLFRIRNGRASPVLAWLTWPIVLVADIGRAITRLPSTMFQEGRYAASNVLGIRSVTCPPSKWSATRIRIEDKYDRSHTDSTVYALTQFIPGVVRPATMLLADTVLNDSYQMMLRRIDTLFRTDKDLERPALRSATGAVTKLAKVLRDNKKDFCYSISLVGHSLGCIAINEIVRRNPRLDFKHVVYMAAACSAKDFMDTVPPYLEAHPSTKFYSLCLHPFADRDEAFLYSLFPNGSLLEWLDSYALDVNTPLDKTFGKWNTAMSTLPFLNTLPERTKKQIHIKGFPVRGKEFPLKHGDFTSFPFWNPQFWAPEHIEPISRYRKDD